MKNLSELYDVTIETEDGDEIYAHKPILVSRYGKQQTYLYKKPGFM